MPGVLMSTTQLDEKKLATDLAASPTKNIEEGSASDAPLRLLEVKTRVPATLPSRLLHRSLLRTTVFCIQHSLRISLRLEGFERLDRIDAPFIIAPNHISLIDSPIMHLNLPSRHAVKTAVVGGLDFFAPREGSSIRENLWRRLVVRFIRGAVNVALINRSGGDYSNLERIDELLSKGWSLVIFPEATRSRTGQLGRMKLGVAELARRYGCPVLPAHIAGTDQVLPVGGGFPRKGEILLRIGEPMRIGAQESSRVFSERLGGRIVALGTEEQAG
jgi:1-acyl-sn-glycerol-3-phosphate acyltransferase